MAQTDDSFFQWDEPSQSGAAENSMSRSDRYTDDLGEMDGVGEQVADFLPSPAELARRDSTVKVTLGLSHRSLDFFKREAAKHHVPYQRMIRALVDEYAQRQMSGEGSNGG